MTKKPRKLEPKLKLDMDFSEALKRFAQTDPKEVADSIARAKQKKPPEDVPSRRPARKVHGDPSPDRKSQPGDG
ncbi:MAG: hypothetical protein NW215_03415 [Hyphomicrobiales bacterium]|nr:hypothetical protein [Hyphomicrobiales bacterium]